MREDILEMSHKDRKRLHIIQKVIDKEMKQSEASKILEISIRQIIRICKRVKVEGDVGVLHKSKGCIPGNARNDQEKERIKKIYKTKYLGFGPTLASEKLEERQHIKINRESLRQLLLEACLIKRRRRVKKRYKYRERRAYRGELIQMDGSHHDWFEGRGTRCVLMGMIDDASNDVFARFYTHEGTVPAMDCFRQYTKQYGLPLAIYLDKHTTYRSPKKLTIEDELEGQKPMSHFQRGLNELDVQLIFAHSPQAKGRIERLFNTLQDRLIKEMRLAKVSNIEEGNIFLKKYLPKYNKRFSVLPASDKDVHRKFYLKSDLENALSCKFYKALRNDRTLVHEKQWYQILDLISTTRVLLSKRYDGNVGISYQGKDLKFKLISKPPKIHRVAKTTKSYKGHKPSPENPFNRIYHFSRRDLIKQLKEKRDSKKVLCIN